MHAGVRMAAIAAAALLSVVAPTSGYAQPSDDTGDGTVNCGIWGCGVDVVDPGSPGSGGGGAPPAVDDDAPGAPPGSKEPKCPVYEKLAEQPAADSSLWGGHSPKDGYIAAVTTVCQYQMGWQPMKFIPAGKAAAPAGPTPQEIAATLSQQARDRLVMPSLRVQVGPDGKNLAVKVPVWFWLDRGQVAVDPVTVTAGAVSVTARAELTSITVSPGEWRSKTAGAAGGVVDALECTGDAMFAAPSTSVSWEQKPPCGYTYGYRSDKDRTDGRGTWQATVTAHWHVVWTSTGAGGAGGEIDVPPAMTSWPLQVGEWRAIGVAPTTG